MDTRADRASTDSSARRPEDIAFLNGGFLAARGLGAAAPGRAAGRRTGGRLPSADLARRRTTVIVRLILGAAVTITGAVLTFGVAPASGLLLVSTGLLLVGLVSVAFDLVLLRRLDRALADGPRG